MLALLIFSPYTHRVAAVDKTTQVAPEAIATFKKIAPEKIKSDAKTIFNLLIQPRNDQDEKDLSSIISVSHDYDQDENDLSSIISVIHDYDSKSSNMFFSDISKNFIESKYLKSKDYFETADFYKENKENNKLSCEKILQKINFLSNQWSILEEAFHFKSIQFSYPKETDDDLRKLMLTENWNNMIFPGESQEVEEFSDKLVEFKKWIKLLK